MGQEARAVHLNSKPGAVREAHSAGCLPARCAVPQDDQQQSPPRVHTVRQPEAAPGDLVWLH